MQYAMISGLPKQYWIPQATGTVPRREVSDAANAVAEILSEVKPRMTDLHPDQLKYPSMRPTEMTTDRLLFFLDARGHGRDASLLAIHGHIEAGRIDETSVREIEDSITGDSFEHEIWTACHEELYPLVSGVRVMDDLWPWWERQKPGELAQSYSKKQPWRRRLRACWMKLPSSTNRRSYRTPNHASQIRRVANPRK